MLGILPLDSFLRVLIIAMQWERTTADERRPEERVQDHSYTDGCRISSMPLAQSLTEASSVRLTLQCRGK
jgi:hypothetical protein